MAASEIYPAAVVPKGDLAHDFFVLPYPEGCRKELAACLSRDQRTGSENQRACRPAAGLLRDQLFGFMPSPVCARAFNLQPPAGERPAELDRWLYSTVPFSEDMVDRLCIIHRIWLTRSLAAIRNLFKDGDSGRIADIFDREIREAVQQHREAEHIRLIGSGGVPEEDAFTLIPFLAALRLDGKVLGGADGYRLHICCSGSGVELISDPRPVRGGKDWYSLGVALSLETLPPHCRSMLQIGFSVRRWISDTWGSTAAEGEKGSEKPPCLTSEIGAKIETVPGRFCTVTIGPDKKPPRSRELLPALESFSICSEVFCSSRSFPSRDALLSSPRTWLQQSADTVQILLPWKNGRAGFRTPEAGTGMSVLDTSLLFPDAAAELTDIGTPAGPALRCSHRGGPRRALSHQLRPDEAEQIQPLFSSSAAGWLGTDTLFIDLYGLLDDPVEQAVLDQTEEQIRLFTGPETADAPLHVHIRRLDRRKLTRPLDLPGGSPTPQLCRKAAVDRSDELTSEIEHSEPGCIRGALVLLEYSPDIYSPADPKAAVRSALARQGIVSQFLVPPSKQSSEGAETLPHRISSAVMDLFRQLGVISFPGEGGGLPNLFTFPCTGLTVLTLGAGGRGSRPYRFPVSVSVNFGTRTVEADCPAFSGTGRKISYREACLETAKLSLASAGKLQELYKSACQGAVRNLLDDLRIRYGSPDSGTILLVKSSQPMYRLWSGLTDGGILAQWNPAAGFQSDGLLIDRGEASGGIRVPLLGTGVRVLRIRDGHAPDYFTPEGKKMAEDGTTSARILTHGLFRFEDVFWSLGEKPNDRRYNFAGKQFRSRHPDRDYARTNPLEIFPLQLQKGDDPEEFAYLAHSLRSLSIQSDRDTKLPLPLHLAELLREYLLDL